MLNMHRIQKALLAFLDARASLWQTASFAPFLVPYLTHLVPSHATVTPKAWLYIFSACLNDMDWRTTFKFTWGLKGG